MLLKHLKGLKCLRFFIDIRVNALIVLKMLLTFIHYTV